MRLQRQHINIDDGLMVGLVFGLILLHLRTIYASSIYRQTREIDETLNETNNLTKHSSSIYEEDKPNYGVQSLPVVAPAEPKTRKLLKCHCDICPNDNYICETDGLCFTSVELLRNELIYSYRCLAREKLLPAENPVWCKEKNDNPFFEMKCCSNDLCNKNIKFILPERGEPCDWITN